MVARIMSLGNIFNELCNLGLEFLKQFPYDPDSPNRIYFSIGEAIAAIVIFLAFTQFTRPIVRFRLATGFFKQTTAYILFLIAILLVFLAAILPFIPGKPKPVWGYPVLWEVIAGLLFSFGTLFFLWRISRRAKLNRYNYKNYLQGCLSLIARGNESDLSELAEEISYSIKEVVKTCKKFNRDKRYFAKQEGKQYEISEFTRYALTLLDTWSDEKFCQIIVCHVPQTAIKFFHEVNEQELYNSGGYAFVNQLVRQAFTNKSSMLHREDEFYGLGHFKTFTKSLFGNYALIESHFRPLQAWDYWREENLEPWKISKYAKTLCIALEAYFRDSNSFYNYPAAIFSAFDTFKGIAMSQSIKLDKLPSEEYESPSFKNLREVQHGLHEALKLLIKHERDLPQYELSKEKYDKFKDFSIYGILAGAIFDYLENLSMARTQDETVRMLAIELWLDVYPVSRGLESKAIIEVQHRLNLHLLKIVEENLTRFFYPAITRLLINIMGLYKEAEGTEERGEILLRNKFFALLRKYFENASKQNPQKARDLLPKDVRYDKDTGQLIQEGDFRDKRTMNLRE
jgi:hypothetical protein